MGSAIKSCAKRCLQSPHSLTFFSQLGSLIRLFCARKWTTGLKNRGHHNFVKERSGTNSKTKPSHNSVLSWPRWSKMYRYCNAAKKNTTNSQSSYFHMRECTHIHWHLTSLLSLQLSFRLRNSRFIQDDRRKGRKGLPFLVSQVADIWPREKGRERHQMGCCH